MRIKEWVARSLLSAKKQLGACLTSCKEWFISSRHEIFKFSCMALMIALVTYIHTLLKMSKDALILSHLTTEVISAIKVWVVLPVSMLVMVLYIKLSAFIKRSTLFQLLTWVFVGFFVLFATVIYPHCEEFALKINPEWITRYPGLKYTFLAISNWHFTLFYLCSELWVTIMLSISAWQTINHVTSLEESKRFYPLLGFCANIGMLVASWMDKNFVHYSHNWQDTLNSVTFSIVVAAAVLSLVLMILVKLIGEKDFNGQKVGGVKKRKVKMGFMDSIRIIFSSRVVLLIVLLLLSYNISLNIIEGIWKKSIEINYHGDANAIQIFLSKVNLMISVFSGLLAIGGVYHETR